MAVMTQKPNFLFIMADQLRWDYLGCAGHPHIKTPNIDALARRGVRFERCYIQSPVCGGSRMSFYSGRYNITHGATYNAFPLRIDEMTLGDYLRPLGYRTVLVGKTHFKPDVESLARLGIDQGNNPGLPYWQCGFEPYERDDGLHPEEYGEGNVAYNLWLNQKGYGGANPWHTWANSVDGDNGEVLSGWSMRHARQPARLKEEHSETAYMTDRALDFLDRHTAASPKQPWCLHLSYIKPHWPYIAPAPYHAMYGPEHVQPANRREAERVAPHPVIAAFMQHDESVHFSRQEVRETVIPTYMGLISQFDQHIGRVVAHLKTIGQAENTVIVVTSDHGDYLGDHWLGEKDLFHEEIVRIPMVVMDPRSQANATRGSATTAFMEAIDLVPTFLDMAGGAAAPHRLEGASIAPLLHAATADWTPATWREAVFCDSDFALRHARKTLGLAEDQARGFMVRTVSWKYVFFERFPPQLFDLVADPHELQDLGQSAEHETIRVEMQGRMFDWLRRRKTRTTVTHDYIARVTGKARDRGIRFGEW
jgi:arylsulfatase A-like enzyme